MRDARWATWRAKTQQVPCCAAEPGNVPRRSSTVEDLIRLAGGDPDVWSVEDGEIVGRSETGLAHNDFLPGAT